MDQGEDEVLSPFLFWFVGRFGIPPIPALSCTGWSFALRLTQFLLHAQVCSALWGYSVFHKQEK